MKRALFHRQNLQRTLARLGLGGLVGAPLAAGCADGLVAPPIVPEGPRFDQASPVSASHLVIVAGLGVAAEGVSVARNVNRGMLAASRNGQADFSLVIRIIEVQKGNQFAGGITPKVEPLTAVKATGALHPAFEAFATVVPWDRRDNDGNLISGLATVQFEIEVRKRVDGKVIGLGTVSGSTELVLPEPVA